MIPECFALDDLQNVFCYKTMYSTSADKSIVSEISTKRTLVMIIYEYQLILVDVYSNLDIPIDMIDLKITVLFENCQIEIIFEIIIQLLFFLELFYLKLDD